MLARMLKRADSPRPGALVEQAFERVFMQAPAGMALVQLDGRLLRVNDALCQITGYSADQLYATTFHDLSEPRDADADAAQVQDLIDGRTASFHVEKRYRHAWGHTVWVLLSLSLVRDDD